VLFGKLNFTWVKPNLTGNANFTFAKQKLHQNDFFIMKESELVISIRNHTRGGEKWDTFC
jgi:hypothetical protein